jgi:hypothetical protein
MRNFNTVIAKNDVFELVGEDWVPPACSAYVLLEINRDEGRLFQRLQTRSTGRPPILRHHAKTPRMGIAEATQLAMTNARESGLMSIAFRHVG